jgi:hypothetical protein
MDENVGVVSVVSAIERELMVHSTWRCMKRRDTHLLLNIEDVGGHGGG